MRSPERRWIARMGLVVLGASVIATLCGTQRSAFSACPTSAEGIATTEEPFRVYLATTGSDTNTGLSPERAVRTLERAQEVLTAEAPDSDVEVRITQGTYVAPMTRWTLLVPGQTVTFLPIDYEYGEGGTGIAGRPVFRGDGTTGFWLRATLPKGHAGGNAGLRFYYLQIEHYDQGGLAINGGVKDNGIRGPATAGHNSNTISGMYFTELGSKWAGPQSGLGGIDLVNSRNNVIENNDFVKLENTGAEGRNLHGVYLAHHSSGNCVRNNRFTYVSGNPIRARNDSNGNDVFGNTFERTGVEAQFNDWFCDTSVCAKKRRRECASHGNRFHDNDNVSGYSGERIACLYLSPPGLDYAGGPGCSNDRQKRVYTSGNTGCDTH